MSIYETFSIILTVLTLLVSGILTYGVNKLSKANTALVMAKSANIKVKNQIRDGIKHEIITVKFRVRQGNVAKFYTAEKKNDKTKGSSTGRNADLQYKVLDYKNSQVTFDVTRTETKNEIFEQDNNTESGIGEGSYFISDLKECYLIALDYTKEWHIYYLLIRPEIHWKDKAYHFSVQADGKEIASYTKTPEPMKSQYLLIDCSLINESTLKAQITDFKNKNSEYHLFKEKQHVMGENGEVFISDPYIKLNYQFPEASEILKDHRSIQSDIKSGSTSD